jgi:uncharacterized Zn finger protein
MWQELRPKIIQQLEAANHYALLTRIYLRDEDWTAAWTALGKVGQRSKSDWGYYSSTLDLEVAEQSRFSLPERAIPVYIKYARASIDQRARQYYQQAAEYLVVVRDLYDTIDEYDAWETLIAGIRSEFRKLPALQDELDKADL